MARFTVCLSHDIDRVYKTYQYLTHDLRRLRFSKLSCLLDKVNPYWCFDKMLEIESRHGVRSTSFFLEESIKPKLLTPKSWKLAFGRYRFRDRDVAKMIKRLDREGWEVGLHGSYDSYRNQTLLQQEKCSLEEVLEKPVRGIRQHYLNLDIPSTWKIQRAVGLQYDASYGLLGDIGYRDGRRHPFVDEQSGMHVIPLALMECYLFQKAKNDPEVALRLACQLVDEAEEHGAVFVVLWHQRMFNDREFPGYAWVYDRLIAECKKRGAHFATCGEVFESMGVIQAAT